MTTLADADLVALTIYGEARNQSLDGKAAVANVIRNRLHDGRWGASYERVVLAPYQFSCWNPKGGRENYEFLKQLAGRMQTGDMPDDPVLKECYWIAQGLQSGALRDNVSGATHYFVTASPVPRWATAQVPIAVIGAHSFFRGIA